MTFELARSLLLSETLTATVLGEALLTAARERVSLARALLNVRALDATRLEQELGRSDLPSLRTVAPVAELMRKLPPGLCSRLMAFPVRLDVRTGTVDVAVADARDTHAPEEIAFHLDAPIRVVRAPLWAIEAAMSKSSRPPPLPPSMAPSRAPPATPAWGTMSIFSDPPPALRDSSHEIAIPLTRRALIAIRAIEAQNPISLDEADIEYPYEPAEDLMQAVENAVLHAAEERQRTVTHTLIPPSFAVPPPPNTERKPTIVHMPSEPPPSQRTSPPSLPFVDINALLAAIRMARTRDELVDLVLLGARTVARRVAIFAVKREVFVGWTCSPEFARVDELRALSLSHHAPSVLMLGAVTGGYLGPIQNNETHAGLLRLMGTSSRDVAVAAVKVLGRPAALILADELGDTMLATRRLDELARAAGDQLALIVRDRK